MNSLMRQLRGSLVLVTSFAAVLLSGCHTAPEMDPVAREQQRIKEQEQGYPDRLNPEQERAHDRQQRLLNPPDVSKR